MMKVVNLDADAYLDILETKVRKSILRKALRAGAKPLVAAMRREAPIMQTTHKNRIPGLLRRKIRVRSGRRAPKGVVTLAVGVGAKDFAGETFYGGFINEGHFTGERPKTKIKNKAAYAAASTAAGRTYVKPNPFRDRAYASTGGTAASTAAASLQAQIAEIS